MLIAKYYRLGKNHDLLVTSLNNLPHEDKYEPLYLTGLARKD